MTKSVLLLVAAIIAAAPVSFSRGAAGQDAPFGFHWGDRSASLPKPSEVLQVKNITALIYKRDNVPAALRDTEEITVKVCDPEGLQQVIWVSRLLSGEDARHKFAAIYAEGVRQHGEADEGDPASGTALWNTAQITMFANLAEPGFYRIFMVQDGPEFQTCSKTHEN
jgi:hypothetical protein